MPVLRSLHLAGGPRGVLLFHGLSSSPQELQFVARGLHRAGYTVSVPVIEGYSFGGADQVLGTHRQWADAALAEFDALRQRCASVAVGGLCIGAVLALQVAALRAAQVDAVLALSTTMHYDGWANPWYRRLLPLAAWVPWVGRFGVRESAPYGVKDERLRGWIANQMRDSGNSDAGAAVLKVQDLLEASRLIANLRRRLADITSPTLLLHAREDDAAAPRSAFEVALRVNAQRVRCVLLADSYHMISIDREKHKVLAEMLDFLQPTATVGGTSPSG
ncbi:MAG: carboxylesterase [Betaproteobacteria bacterium]|nr:carboxylesterase [Betaproteobacteria bacterium]